MGTSLGVADTMALISSKLSNLVPFSCCALFLYNEELETLRCRFATGVDAEVIQQISVKSGHGLTGWVARNRRPLVNARPSADLEAAGIPGTTSLQSALVCPLVFNERFIGTLSVYHIDAAVLHRRPSPAARSRLRAGRRGHLQLDRVRADAGRLADRSADRPAEHALHVHAPHARARARRAPEVGGVAARHGPRQLQGDQRQPRPPCRRPRAARSRGRAARRPSGPTTSASATRATSSSSCCRGAAPRRPSGSGSSCRRRSTTWSSRRGRASALQLGISIGAAVFPHDGDTLRNAAGHRRQPDVPRQDRSAKRTLVIKPGMEPMPSSRRDPVKEITDSELQRAASGVLVRLTQALSNQADALQSPSAGTPRRWRRPQGRARLSPESPTADPERAARGRERSSRGRV